MKITKKITPNQSDRKGYKPDIIVCHITDGSYNGAVGWHCNAESGVSSHYIISRSGERTDIVPLDKMAWCNGTTTNGDYRDCKYSTLETVRRRKTNANYYTISIECEGYYNQTKGALTEVQLNALIETIQEIREKVKRIYGVNIPADRKHIVGHNEINPRTRACCPGENFPWDELMKKLNGKQTESYAKKIYRVQIGAYTNRGYAETMANKLKANGYPAIIKESEE